MKDVVVKEGYTLMSLVMDANGRYYAIIYRNIRYPDYVVACGYDINDGTWGAGIYCCDYATALEILKEHI